MVDQARLSVQGGENDYNSVASDGNRRRMDEEACLAAQERAKATGAQGMQVAPSSIAQRDKNSIMTRDKDGKVINKGFTSGVRYFGLVSLMEVRWRIGTRACRHRCL